MPGARRQLRRVGARDERAAQHRTPIKQCVCDDAARAFDALLGSLEDVIAQNYVYYTLRAVVPAMSRRSGGTCGGSRRWPPRCASRPGPVAHVRVAKRFAVVRSGKGLVEETGEELLSGACIGKEMFGDDQPAAFSHTVVAATDAVLLEISWPSSRRACPRTPSSPHHHHLLLLLLLLLRSPRRRARNRKGDADWDILSEAAPNLDVYGDAVAESRGASPVPPAYPHPLASLVQRRRVGEGQFGGVFLVEDPDRRLLALKSQDKRRLFDAGAVAGAVSERDILRDRRITSHPFVCDLVATFQDAGAVYLALEYLPGAARRGAGPRSGACAVGVGGALYLRCVASALERLHENHIVHRDCRAENMVLDERGYPRLVDFGLASACSRAAGSRSRCAARPSAWPRSCWGPGHGVAADCWSAGVLCYELMAGSTPFGAAAAAAGDEDDADPMEVVRNILQRDVSFPKAFGLGGGAGAATRRRRRRPESLCGTALDRDPSTRLGCGRKLRMSDHGFLRFDDAPQCGGNAGRGAPAPWVPPAAGAPTPPPMRRDGEEGERAAAARDVEGQFGTVRWWGRVRRILGGGPLCVCVCKAKV